MKNKKLSYRELLHKQLLKENKIEVIKDSDYQKSVDKVNKEMKKVVETFNYLNSKSHATASNVILNR